MNSCVLGPTWPSGAAEGLVEGRLCLGGEGPGAGGAAKQVLRDKCSVAFVGM